MPLCGYCDPTNAIELKQTSEAAFADILSARAKLDEELQADANKLDVKQLTMARNEISHQARQLSRAAGNFLQQFPTNNNSPSVVKQQVFGIVMGGMLHKEWEVEISTMTELIPSCLFETSEAEMLSVATQQVALFQSAAESGFADGVIAAIRIGPESFNSIFMFLERARTDAGRKLAQALLNSPGTDETLKSFAESVLKRKYGFGQPLPIKFTAIDGRKVDVSEMRGKVILVNFWGTSCVPCINELPELKSLYEKYRDQGLEIVGISKDSDEKPVLRVIHDKTIPWPIYVEADGHTNKFAAACGIAGIPDNWLVDRKGVVREMMADQNLENKIRFLLAESP
jgi:thiol-disulfide isomerase/thioredoxin